LGHLLLAELDRQSQVGAPPVEDVLLDGQGQLAGYADGRQDLPAALAVLADAVSGGVGDADLG